MHRCISLVLLHLLGAQAIPVDFELLVGSNVCFSAISGFGSFTVPRSGVVTAVRLVYKSGGIACAVGVPISNWGCTTRFGANTMQVAVVTPQNQVVLPATGTTGFTGFQAVSGIIAAYDLPPYDYNSPEIVLNGPAMPMTAGTAMGLAHLEVVAQQWIGDNSGTTCAAVYLTYQGAPPCPPVAGYTVTANVAHYFNDIFCSSGVALATVASWCSPDPKCTAFETFGADSGCAKTVAMPRITRPSGEKYCSYIKNSAPADTEVLAGSNVCFSAASGFGAFTVPRSGVVTAVRLAYKYGGTTCEVNSPISNWGCTTRFGANSMQVAVVTPQNQLVLPATGTSGFFGFQAVAGIIVAYDLAPYNYNSPEIVLNGPATPMAAGTALGLAHLEAVAQQWTGDNSGTTCADVYLTYQAQCPPVAGYTATANVAHYFDDIKCANGVTLATIASWCSPDPRCKAFNTFGTDSGCAKTMAVPTIARPISENYCSYVKNGAPFLNAVAFDTTSGDSNSTSSTSTSSALSWTMVIGIVCGSVIFAALVAAAFVVGWRARQQAANSELPMLDVEVEQLDPDWQTLQTVPTPIVKEIDDASC